MPRRPQGVDGLWRFNGWGWRRLQRRRRWRFPRAPAARDVRCHLLELRQDGPGAVPPDERQARLLRRLLPAPPRLTRPAATELQSSTEPRPKGRGSCLAWEQRAYLSRSAAPVRAACAAASRATGTRNGEHDT